MAKAHDYNYEKYRDWKRNIPKNDVLKEEKKDSLLNAIDLGYKDETLEKII